MGSPVPSTRSPRQSWSTVSGTMSSAPLPHEQPLQRDTGLDRNPQFRLRTRSVEFHDQADSTSPNDPVPAVAFPSRPRNRCTVSGVLASPFSKGEESRIRMAQNSSKHARGPCPMAPDGAKAWRPQCQAIYRGAHETVAELRRLWAIRKRARLRVAEPKFLRIRLPKRR